MRWLFAALIVVSLSAPAATAGKEMSPAAALAYNNFHHEMVECVAYYSIVADALQRRGDEEAFRKYKQSIDGLLERIFLVGQEIGMMNEAARARLRISTEEQLKSINNDYVNISILFDKYAYLCKDVIEKPEERFLHWLKKANEKP